MVREARFPRLDVPPEWADDFGLVDDEDDDLLQGFSHPDRPDKTPKPRRRRTRPDATDEGRRP